MYYTLNYWAWFNVSYCYGAPNQSIFPTFFYGLFDFLHAQLDFLYGQHDFLYGQLFTFYIVNTTFYMVN